MKTFQQLYEDLLRQKVSVEEPLPKEYDPKLSLIHIFWLEEQNEMA